MNRTWSELLPAQHTLGRADQNITLSIYSHAMPADTRAAAKIWNDAMADVISESRKPGGGAQVSKCLHAEGRISGSV